MSYSYGAVDRKKTGGNNKSIIRIFAGIVSKMDKLSGAPLEEGLTRLTADVVAAYVSNNTLPTGQLAELIHSVYASLKGLDGTSVESKPEPAKPATTIKKSITPDYLICLEDGKKLKMLKRHLRSTYNMTPDEYRTKWNLPPDYPMVAPNYAQQRSDFAKQIGLGRGAGRTAGRRAKKG
jgi:predicted transcriptional regulator